MASSNECPDTTQVLLVDPQSLPVLLHGNSDINGSNISVDLLQQALQGTSAIDGDDGDPTEEVSLDVLGGNGDVLAIYQGEGGQTHTIKISLAEAQSLGLQLSDDNFPISLSDGSLANSLKVTAVGDQLVNNSNGALNDASLLQSVTCSDGRIIDEEGNIVEASEALQILPSSLSSFLDDGLNQSLSIVPQYELDGTVTYAVKLKDQNEAVLGPDYHVLEPDSSAKTGLDIEEELKNSSLKQNLLQTAETITAESLGLTATVALNDTSNSSSSTIQLPISTLEALSKQMLLPVSSSSVPISVTLTLPTETSVSTHQQSVSSNSVTNPNGGRYFQLVSDRCSVGLNNVISADAATVPLGTIVPQPTLTVNQQHPHLIAPSTTMLSVQSQPSVALLSNNRSINQTTSRHQIISEKLPPILAAPKLLPSPAIKTATAPKKLPISANVVSPAAVSSNIIHSPVMAAVPPTSQPNLGGAAISKSTGLSSGRLSHINSNSSKPLGSSENPIQLVQQGQTFHSMQALNQAQLRQIATVLQQKNLNSNSTATKNVLFDEQTKTRIVYRVVYPEDVDLQQPTSPSEKAGNFGSHSSKLVSRSRGRAGRPKMKRRSKKSDAEKYSKIESDPVLDSSSSHATDTKSGDLRDESILPEEPPKVEKKKILGSRTRSGRVSRPPRHMMKDFKHLHHTDYNKDKDGDDSDGYSDYSNPEQPPEKVCIKEVEDVSPVKRKVSRFSCPTCSKLYLGVGRMEKHFQQHPDHGSFEEFKKQLAACTPAEFNTPGVEARGERTPGGKANLAKGKKRNQSSNQTDSSETRKKKLKQALQACEISEILEVAGPLIARYCTLWDLLLLRLVARDDSTVQRVNVKEEIEKTQSTTNLSEGTFNVQDLSSINETSSIFAVDCSTENSHHCRSTSNRVQWLLMELSSLAETLQSLSGDLFQPALIHCDDKVQIEINQKSVSELFGVSCGMYNVYEEQLSKRMQSLTGGSNERVNESLDAPPHKVSRKLDEAEDLALALNHGDSEVCSESLSSLSLMVKPVDTEKAILAKLTEDMPFLNSSDDMICGSDPDLSTDSKREQDCDSATGLQAVDDIVNERLKNLSDNMNFAVPLQSDLESSDINADQSDLHLISSFGSANASISVSNPSVISSSLTENSKQSSSISNMDLMSSYSITSLSRPGAHDVNISNSEPSNELTSALEPVSSQTILGGFGIGLSALSSFDTLQSQSSNVPHSEDSFLESLGSFETPLTQAHLPQTCGSSNASGSSFDNGVMKSNSILQMTNEASESTRLPPKFISSFTPAVTSDKSTTSISTAQRLQRSYLELDDDGLDLDFDAFTQELSMNRNSSA